jgi:hypothetical protein
MKCVLLVAFLILVANMTAVTAFAYEVPSSCFNLSINRMITESFFAFFGAGVVQAEIEVSTRRRQFSDMVFSESETHRHTSKTIEIGIG